jgi:AcrR family transcriptional regulator
MTNAALVPAEHGPRRASTKIRHQDLADRLVATAEGTIAESGLANLRARALAEAVGCSPGAIYLIFPDLDALILVINGRTLDAIDAAMRDAGSADKGPLEHMVALADAYIDYAAANRNRWNALFQHSMPDGRAVSPWFAERQAAAFAHIEAPLAVLLPDVSEQERSLLARSLFSAVHGMVALGLDEKVAAMPLPVLRAQVRLVVTAICRGLATGPN